MSKRTRSPNYPAISLPKALARAAALREEAQQRYLPLHAAHQLWGYIEGGSAGNQCVAALKAYGLIDVVGKGEDRQIRISDVAYQILLEAPEAGDLIKSAALRPTLHKELWEQDWGGGRIGHPDTVKRYLLTSRGFNEKAVDAFVSDFMETIQFAKLDSDAMIEPSGGNGRGSAQDTGGGGVGDSIHKVKTAVAPEGTKANVQELTLPLLGGGMAILKVPVPMSEANFKQLSNVLNAMKAALVINNAASNQDKPQVNADSEAKT